MTRVLAAFVLTLGLAQAPSPAILDDIVVTGTVVQLKDAIAKGADVNARDGDGVVALWVLLKYRFSE